jgi:8-oxo-dGTP pyrophosphatase MutT (NUDIX family)
VSYLRHLELCNAFDPGEYVPFLVDAIRVGFIRRAKLAALAGFPAVFRCSDRAVRLAPALDTPAKRSAALAETVAALVERGEIPALRHEAFAVSAGWGGPTLFELDRGAVPCFGTRAYGVHVNGYRQGPDGLSMWVGTRALDKKVAPGKLDNLVAGGIGAGYDAASTLVKEAAEEADIPEALTRRARPVGAVLYRMSVPEGARDDVLFCYDLETPADFVPRNTDGEITSFALRPFAECLDLVRDTDEFKFNVNLILIDFALRHGALAPETPDYLALLTGLRGGLIREAGAGTDLGG